MITLDGLSYLMYKNYRTCRQTHKAETVSQAFGLNHEDAETMENWYQREINGEPMGLVNQSCGVAVLEL